VQHLVVTLIFVLTIHNSLAQRSCRPSAAGGRSGVCQNVDNLECSGGRYYRGACPGASNIQCCVTSSGGGSPSGGDISPSVGSGSTSPVGAGWGSYQPPASALNALGGLFSRVTPNPVRWGYSGAKATFMLPGGAFYIESKMDTDCDGAPSCPSIDPHGQTQTSWNFGGRPIDALRANYFVLPSNIKGRLGSTRLGLGDIAAVIYNGRLEFAVYADNGPTSKIGEGSVALVQSLGFNPYKNGRICCGITSGVVTIVFPGSRGTYTSPYDKASVRQAGMSRLNALMGSNAIADSNAEFSANTQSQGASGVPLSPLLIALFAVVVIVALAIVIAALVGVVSHVKASQDEQRP